MSMHQTQEMRHLQNQMQLLKAREIAWEAAIDMVITMMRQAAVDFLEEKNGQQSSLAMKLKPLRDEGVNPEALQILVLGITERIRRKVDAHLRETDYEVINLGLVRKEISDALGYILTDNPPNVTHEDANTRKQLLLAHKAHLRRDNHFEYLIDSGAELRDLKREDLSAVEDLYEEFRLRKETVGQFAAGVIERTDETFIRGFSEYELGDMNDGLKQASKKKARRIKAPYMKGRALWSPGGTLLGVTANKIWSPKVEKTSAAYIEMQDFFNKGTSGGDLEYIGGKHKRGLLESALEEGKLLQLTLVMGKVRRAASMTMASAYRQLGKDGILLPDSVGITYFLKRLHMQMNEVDILEGLDDLGANVSSQALCGKFGYGEGGPFAVDSNRNDPNGWVHYQMDADTQLSVTPEWSHITTPGQRLLERAEKYHH